MLMFSPGLVFTAGSVIFSPDLVGYEGETEELLSAVKGAVRARGGC